MTLRLWWKATDIGRLHPVRKIVHRLGQHGDLQVFLQTYYEAPEQPEHPTPEGVTELVDTAKVSQWYDDLRDEYDRETGDASWRDYAWGLKRSDWEKVVNDAHKDLNETFGTDRVGVVVPTLNTAFGIALNKDLVGLAYLGMLAQYWHAEVVRHILDRLELPYVFRAAVATPINAPTPALMLNLFITRIFKRMPEEMTEPLLLGDEVNVVVAPLPDTVLDPNSKKEIQTDDYFKRLLPLLESELGGFTSQIWGDVKNVLVSEAQRAAKRSTIDYAVSLYRPPHVGLTTTPAQWEGISEWIERHPEVFKALFSFVLPTGDREVALLGLYAGIKTMRDFVKLCNSPEVKEMGASDIMQRVQEDFEREVEEGKKVFGLERFPIPPRRVWETLWLALDSLNKVGGEPQQGITGTLRDLLKWENWEQIEWSDQHSNNLKHVIAALFGHDAVKGFDDKPFRWGLLGMVLRDLRRWGARLGNIGLAALGENLQQLKEKVQALEPSEGSDLQQVAQKAVRKFHNALSSVIKSVQKVKGGFTRELGEVGKVVALIDYSPMGFYSLTRDGTCFGRSNIHHPFLLSAVKNSFVLRVFLPGFGYMGRMWGILAPDAKTVYLTNRYGSINKPHFRALALQIFSSLFQSRPEDLSIDEGNKVTDELHIILDTLAKQAASKIGRMRNTDLRIYLNEGDAVKISVRGMG
jgi:hypothetical protein